MDIPSIIIFKCESALSDVVKEILYGIEEESIPYILENASSSVNVVKLSHDAALKSALSVGIALDDKDIVIHYANLEESRPLFNYKVKLSTKQNFREYGMNAARMVKGTAFVVDSREA